MATSEQSNGTIRMIQQSGTYNEQVIEDIQAKAELGHAGNPRGGAAPQAKRGVLDLA